MHSFFRFIVELICIQLFSSGCWTYPFSDSESFQWQPA